MGQNYAIMKFNYLCHSGNECPIPTLALPLKGRELGSATFLRGNDARKRPIGSCVHAIGFKGREKPLARERERVAMPAWAASTFNCTRLCHKSVTASQ